MSRSRFTLLGAMRAAYDVAAAPRDSMRSVLERGQKRIESALAERESNLERVSTVQKLKLINLEVVHAGLEQVKQLTDKRADAVSVGGEARFAKIPFRERSLLGILQQLIPGADRESEGSPKFDALESFRLRGEGLPENVLQELTDCRNLRLLALNGVDLNDDMLLELSVLTQLRMLDLSENPRLTNRGLEVLRQFPDLRLLSLDGTGANNDCGALLAGISGLTWLSLVDTGVDDAICKQLAGCPRLESLDLTGTRISDASAASLGENKRLKKLSVAAADIGDQWIRTFVEKRSEAGAAPTRAVLEEGRRGLSQLANAVGADRLTALPVVGRVAEAGLEYFDVPSLEMLDLERTRVTDRGVQDLVSLPGLAWLNLDGTRITDAALESLRRIPTLRTLSLMETRVSPAAIERFQTQCEQCEVYS